jgi:hypothetical protein
LEEEAQMTLFTSSAVFLDADADIGRTFLAGTAFAGGAARAWAPPDEDDGPKLLPSVPLLPASSASCETAVVGAKLLPPAASWSSIAVVEGPEEAAKVAFGELGSRLLLKADISKCPLVLPATVAGLGADAWGLTPGLVAVLAEKSRIAPNLLVAIAWRCAGVMFTADSGASCLPPILPGPLSVGMVGCENDARPPGPGEAEAC